MGLSFSKKIKNCHVSNQFWILATWYLNLFINILSVENNLFFDKRWFMGQNSKLESKAPSTKMKRIQNLRVLILFFVSGLCSLSCDQPDDSLGLPIFYDGRNQTEIPRIVGLFSVWNNFRTSLFIFREETAKKFQRPVTKIFCDILSKIHMCRI